MEQGHCYGNVQQSYRLPQRQNLSQPPRTGAFWDNGYAMTHENSPAVGYVHSSYQAAIQGTSHQALSSSQNGWPNTTMETTIPNTRNNTKGRIRPPRYGPGGPVRCSHLDCPYSGYPKDVEVHQMDRHLIFPPGYKKQKGPPDGEVGPNKAIPGTGIALNTPEVIEAWISERKKKWPTTARVAEQHKRKAEAIERGELEHIRSKRPRLDAESSFTNTRGRGRGRGRGYQRGRGRGLGRGIGIGMRFDPLEDRNNVRGFTQLANSNRPVNPAQPVSDDSSREGSGSGSDIDPEKDIVSSKLQLPEEPRDGDDTYESSEPETIIDAIKVPKRRPPKQPPKRPYNPLVDRPSFLRKLLQPEIRHTVSNLSQAVRFIVDNDFFQGMELKPGEAEGSLITELDSQPTAVDSANQIGESATPD